MIEIDQYLNRYSKKKLKTSNLEDIFEKIRTQNINIPKAQRKGNIFSTRTNLGRKHKDIKEFTGLMFIDIDKCTDHNKVKDLFINIENTVATWFSSSGKNVHALIKIPICENMDEFKRRYKAFIELLELYIRDFATIDTITANPTQLAFESHDKDLFINETPIEFKKISPKQVPQPTNIICANNITPTKGTEQWIIDWTNRTISLITNPGYTQLLCYSKTLGGYCSGGYIDKELASSVLHNAIESNSYFKSKESSGTMQTYHKGGEGSFIVGLKEPLKWSAKPK